MTSPEHLLRDLCKHLGITHVLHTHTGPYGKTIREHHLFVDGPIIHEVLKWAIRRPELDTLRVFQGDPPPF